MGILFQYGIFSQRILGGIMSDDDNNNSGMSSVPMDDQPGDELAKLKNDVQILQQMVKKLTDSVAEVTNTQGSIAKAITGAVSMAKMSLDELTKTRTEFTAALSSVQAHPLTKEAIKEGMVEFATEIERKTTATLEAFNASINEQLVAIQGAGASGALQQSGPMGFVNAFLNSEAGKLIVAKFLAPPAPVQQLGIGDLLGVVGKVNKLVGDMGDIRNMTDEKIARLVKDGNEIKFAPANPATPATTAHPSQP
jgi:hypothetical protein